MSNPQYFIYCRKSSEDSQKQVASINDQIHALIQVVEREQLNLVRPPFTEEKSAKDPGRVIFNEMLARIEKGEANALFCWDIDRLSRNPIDNGRLQWMLQKGVISIIKTPLRSYYPEDAGLLLSIEGGRATDYVMRLSRNVKRGMNSRALGGWRPCIAPIGYLNIGNGRGYKAIQEDPERFQLIRKMWDMFLSGGYSVSKIRRIATDEWGLRTTKRRKIGGTPISLNHMYNIFKDKFYYGYYLWRNPETNEPQLIKGNHTAMITEEEYWRAQVLLGRKGKPQPKTREFAFTGCMKCGECNSSITAEEKNQIICTKCRYKFSYLNAAACPRCSCEISDMVNPTVLKYVYYRCVKKKGIKCRQKYITVDELEGQVIRILESLTIDESLLNPLIECLQEQSKNVKDEEEALKLSLQSVLADCQKKLTNLQNGYLSPLNSNHELFTEQEFLTQKRAIISEKEAIEKKMRESKADPEKEKSFSQKLFTFCRFAKDHFNFGDIYTKRIILRSLGSNLTLMDKKLLLDKHFPYFQIESFKKEKEGYFDRLEPENSLTVQEPNELYGFYFPLLCSSLDAIRTWIRNNMDNLPEIPELEEPKIPP